MLQEPLLVVGAFYILFFTVIIYVRLDFSITKVLYSRLQSLWGKIVGKVSMRKIPLAECSFQQDISVHQWPLVPIVVEYVKSF